MGADMGYLFTGTVLVLLMAIYQYYGIYNQLSALQFQCDANVEKSNNEVQLLTDTLRTRAQDYLTSFKKLKDEYDAKDRESYTKIQDLMQKIEQEKDDLAESQGAYNDVSQKLQQSEDAKRAIEQDKTSLHNQLAQLQNEKSLMESQKLDLQQRLKNQVAEVQECRSKESDLARQLQEANSAKQALVEANAQVQQEQAQNKPHPVPENPQPVVVPNPENPQPVVVPNPENPQPVVVPNPENPQPVQNIE